MENIDTSLEYKNKAKRSAVQYNAAQKVMSQLQQLYAVEDVSDKDRVF